MPVSFVFRSCYDQFMLRMRFIHASVHAFMICYAFGFLLVMILEKCFGAYFDVVNTSHAFGIFLDNKLLIVRLKKIRTGFLFLRFGTDNLPMLSSLN